jgi:hypothetical protein
VKTFLKKIQSPKSPTKIKEVSKLETMAPTTEEKKMEQNISSNFSFKARSCVSCEIFGETPIFNPDEFGDATETVGTTLHREGSFWISSMEEDHPVLLKLMELGKTNENNIQIKIEMEDWSSFQKWSQEKELTQ